MQRINKWFTLSLPKGFSLIELMIVISIMGILVAIASTSYANAQLQSRDTKRRADMKIIQNTMEQYYSLNNRYTTVAATFTATGNVVPTDPKAPSQNYILNVSATSDSYCACALLENTVKSNASSPGASSTCTWIATGTHFCVQNQQ